MQAVRISRMIAKKLVLLYQNILSPIMLHACRYQPSCSNYALEALERFGTVRGTWLTVKRLLRCHPLASLGHDPVPAK